METIVINTLHKTMNKFGLCVPLLKPKLFTISLLSKILAVSTQKVWAVVN